MLSNVVCFLNLDVVLYVMCLVGAVLLWVVSEFRHIGVGCWCRGASSCNSECGVLCYL